MTQPVPLCDICGKPTVNPYKTKTGTQQKVKIHCPECHEDEIRRQTKTGVYDLALTKKRLLHRPKY